MARDVADDTYYAIQSKGGKSPVKWTAPEVRALLITCIILMACFDYALLSMKLAGK